MWVLDATTQRILSVNKAAIQAYGYTREEFRAMSLGDLHPIGESSPAYRQTPEQLGSTATLHRRQNGQAFHVAVRSFSTQYYGTMALVVQAFDIQPQAEAEQRVRRYAERLSQTLEGITEGFFTVGRDWRLTYANAESERLLRREKHVLLGRNLWEFFPESVYRNFHAKAIYAMERQVSTRFEEYYPAPLDRWFAACAYPIEDGLAVSFADVTERKKAEQIILEQNRQLREIAWVQSHKVRAPLARLMGLVQIINQADFADPNNELLLKYIINEARQLDAINTEVVQKSYGVAPDLVMELAREE